MVVCTCHNPNRRVCSGTKQGIVMGAAEMLTQGFNNCTNLQDRNTVPTKRHGLSNRLQTSSYGARKVLSTICNRKGIIKIVKQDCVEKRPNRISSYFVPKFKCSSPPKTCSGANPNSSSNIALGVAYLTPQMCLRYLS